MPRNDSLATLHLRHGHAKPLRAGHPWVFAAAVAAREGEPAAGDEVRVVDEQGQVLGHGYYSPDSAIAVRLLTRGDEAADDALLKTRLEDARRWRRELLGLGRDGGAETNAYRLVHSEGDGLGGLIVDVYGAVLCVQVGSAGMQRRLPRILDILEDLLHPRTILDKSDARAQRAEGLTPRGLRLLRGKDLDGPVEVLERGTLLRVDLGSAQKTGLYLDQYANRRRFAEFAQERDVLDVFSYVGGFSLQAAHAGAKSLTLMDSSEPALTAARENLERNGVADADLVCAEWSEGLRHLREAGRTYDLAVVDPPKFARGKEAVATALTGYRELNAQTARLIRPGGVLFTCSCSGNVSELEFERAVASGLARAGRRGSVLERRGAAPDHPIPPGFEQGRYLKCLIVRVA